MDILNNVISTLTQMTEEEYNELYNETAIEYKEFLSAMEENEII